ncbi:MAG: glycosyltransferase family 39 protein [Anaerolineales bacterium]|nr:glycosyltransferase family 39 protein [Anaerolineales bacterium]
MSQARRIGWIGLGGAGVIFSLIISTWFSVSAFIDPLFPYASYENDIYIALGYLVIFIFIGISILLGKYRWLGFSAWIIGAAFVLVAARTTYLALSILTLLWFLWVSWCIGDAAIQRMIDPRDISDGERAVLAIVLGWGVLVVLTLFLGLIGLYQKWFFYLLFSLAAIWGIWKHGSWFSRWRPELIPDSWLGALVLSLLMIIAAGIFMWALAPAVRYDSVSYHLAVPARYLEAGRMIELPESFQTYFAHYGEMLYVIAFALGDQPLPGLINFSAGILLVIQTYYLGKRLGNQAVGWIAAVILFSLPIIGIESATTYIDIFIALFVASALHAAILWSQGNGDKWLLLVGLFSGLALGTKLTALWLLLPFLGLIFVGIPRKKGVRGGVHPHAHPFFGNVLSVAVIVIPVLLLWSPWLIRDWLWTGNPIFPNLNPIFQSSKWFDRNFFIFQPTLKTFQGILYFPWLGVADSHSYYHEAPGAVLGALPMLSLPWFYGRHPLGRKERSLFLVLFLASFAAMALLFGFGVNARYLMPLYPLLSVLAALNVAALGQLLFKWRKFLGVAFVLFGVVYIFSTRLAFTVRWWEIPERYPFQVWLGEESPEQFVDRILPVYGAFEYLDQQGRFKVLSVGNELRLYTNSEIYGVFFSKEAYQVLHSAASADELAQNLEGGGYDYILIYPPEQEHRPEIYTSPALNQDFFERYTYLEYNQRDVFLYRFIVGNIVR